MSSLKEAEEDYFLLPEGTFPIKLTLQTQEELECVAGLDMHAVEPLKWIDIEIIRADIAKKGNQSDFANIREVISNCRVSEALLVYSQTRSQGSEYLICLNEDSKFGYQQSEEDSLLRLIDKSTNYVYQPPVPREGEEEGWEPLGSERDIEVARVKNSRAKICLQIRRSTSRRHPSGFTDRNVNDAKDGYVSCDSTPLDASSSSSSSASGFHASVMERAVQAVPTVVEGGSQTELRHPKNIAIQYQARVFSQEEVAELWKSEEMRKFLGKAEIM